MQAPETHIPKPVAKTSRERLENISRHFLGDDKRITGNGQDPFFLPVLLDPYQKDFPMEAFVETFQAHGKTACLLSPDNEKLSDESIFSGNRAGHSRDLQSMPDICLIPLSDPHHPCIAKFGRVLMLVPTSLDGIQQAYVHLKHWSHTPSIPTVGITMLGNEKRASSVWLFSGKLVSGAMSFLKWQPMSFGYLLMPEDGGIKDASIGLDEVTNLIIRDWLKNRNETLQPGQNVNPDISNADNESLSIQAMAHPDDALVKQLINESITSLGDLKSIDTQPPFSVDCILASDTKGSPVVISFDQTDPGSALVNGLTAVNEIHTNRKWMLRLYSGILNIADAGKVNLIILSAEIPPAFNRLVDSDAHIIFFRYQMLCVDGKPGLLLEPLPANDIRNTETNNSIVNKLDKTMDLIKPVEFTEEEESFFENL